MNRPIQPKEGEYAPYYEKYISYTDKYDLRDILLSQIDELREYLASKDEGWFLKAYNAGKWTPKELIGHVIDTERIFAYRSLCLARGEGGMLPGFDENSYVDYADFNAVTVDVLIENFELSRKSLLTMMRTFQEQAFSRSGIVNGSNTSCRACLTIIAGHFIHHMTILKEMMFAFCHEGLIN